MAFRSEARGVPTLLVEPRSPPATTTSKDGSTSPDRYNRNFSNAGGYYADGAYVAVPDINTISSRRTVTGNAAGVEEDLGVDLDPDPQEAYYVALLHRFTALRIVLQSQPPAAAVTAASIPGDIIHTIRKWRWVLLHRQPAMALLSQLPQESVINGLAALESVLQRGELRKEGGQRLGAWAWGLLAKCREVGQMGSEEVGVLRGLGKRAWWALREIRAGIEEEADEEGIEEEAEEEGKDEEADEEGIEDGMAARLEDQIDGGIEDEVEEGEVQSEEEEQGSGDEDGHDADGEKAQSPVSPTHVTPTSFKDISTTTTIGQTTFTPSQRPSSNPLLSEPPNGHNQDPSPPPPQDPPSTNPPNPLLTAMQQRLLQRLSSPSSSPPPPRNPTPPSEEQQQQQQQGRDTETANEKQLRMSATLDMILTVVGERYGQRDLLIGRGFWGGG